MIMNLELTPKLAPQGISDFTDIIQLQGDLILPSRAQGVVLIAQSGNIKNSHYDNLSNLLYRANLATLTINLLTPSETIFDQHTRQLRFDAAGVLANRVINITDWLHDHPETQHLPIGYFGEGAVGAAILVAATKRISVVKAVVSLGGWLDLIWPTLSQVYTPTLLIVGELDLPMITVNQEAIYLINQVLDKCMEIIPGASHRFVESEALEKVESMTSEWFQLFLHDCNMCLRK